METLLLIATVIGLSVVGGFLIFVLLIIMLALASIAGV